MDRQSVARLGVVREPTSRLGWPAVGGAENSVGECEREILSGVLQMTALGLRESTTYKVRLDVRASGSLGTGLALEPGTSIIKVTLGKGRDF